MTQKRFTTFPGSSQTFSVSKANTLGIAALVVISIGIMIAVLVPTEKKQQLL